ncbi:MAG: BON domain-containing protein [wastewater metagenome]|nr:BON domain-containing protein [Candidatus Loosdrechtia aerotolerans]
MRVVKLQTTYLTVRKRVSFQWYLPLPGILFAALLYMSVIVPPYVYAKDRSSADSSITFAVETKLLMDEMLSHYLIDVKTNNSIVTLSGFVNNSFTRERAARIAETVKGIQLVVNTISLSPLSASEIKTYGSSIPDPGVYRDKRLSNTVIREDERIISSSGKSAAKKSYHTYRPVTRIGSTTNATPLKITKEVYDTIRESGNRSDEEIRRVIKTDISKDTRILSLYIDVEVHEGVVTLTGVVDNLKAKKVAEEIAKNTAGVLTVKNDLKVRPGKLPEYSTLAEHVHDLLSKDSKISYLNIKVKVQNSRVYLSGMVNSLYEKEYIEDMVLKIAGVTDVANKLTVAPTLRDDEKLKERVETELTFSVFVHGSEVSIDAKNGIVYLTGTVHDHLEALAAIEGAFKGGAREVRNFLKTSREEDEGLKELRTPELLYTEIDYPDFFEDFYFRPYYFYLLP